MALTDKKRRFLAALQSGLTGAKAAIQAGYSEKGAAQAASRLMKDKAVSAALARAPEVNKSAPPKPSRIPKPVAPPASGFTAPAGTKTQDAPTDWPFGMEPPPVPPPPPPEPPEEVPEQFDDPREFLKHVMNDIRAEPKERIDAAKALLPFEHARLAPRGKKDVKSDPTRPTGRFAVTAPPKLVVNNRK